uniref:Uncharacterized protein LOC116952026 n=1 Tax=Petromyzon marinus TaxID=7757 RepID=A0AAJ7X9V8_PETMA|nr:uncharacterized protein LOC116952026 [Petromyzon marinus]
MSNRCRRDLASYIHEHDGSGGGGGADEAQWRAEVLCQRCSSTDVRRVEHVEHAGRMEHAAARDANVCREAAAHTQVSSSERERERCDCCRAQGRAAGHGGDAIRGPMSPEKHRAPERVRRNSRGEGTHGGLCRNKPAGPKSNPTIGIAYPQQKAVPHRRAPGPRPPVNGSYRFHVPRIPEREAELQKEDIGHRQRGEAPHFHARPPVGKCPPLPTRTAQQQQQQHDASPQVFPDGRMQGGAFREELGPVAHIPHFHRSATAATPWGFASAGGEAASSDEGNLLLSGVEASLLAQSLQAVCGQQRPLPRDSPPEPLAQGPYSLQPPPRFCHREHSVHRLPYGEMHSVPFPCTAQLPVKHFPLPLLQQSTLCHHGPIAPWVERTHPSAPFSPMEPSDDESSGPAQAAPFGFQGPCLPTFDGSATSDCGFLIQKHGSLKQMPAGFSTGNAAEQVASDGVNGTDTFLLPPWELQEAPLLCVEADKGLPFLCGQEPRLDQLTHGTVPKNNSSISGSSVGHQEQHMSLGPVPLGLAKLPWQQIYHAPITTNQNRIELSRQLSKQHLVMSALAPHGKDCADRKRPLLPLDEVSAWRCEAVEGYSGAPQGPVPTFPPHESQEPRIPGVFSLPQAFFGAHVSRGKATPVPIRAASMAASLQMSPSCASPGGPWLGRARAGPWGCEGGMPPSDAGLDLPAPGERQSQLDAAGQLLQDSLCRVMGMHVAAQNQQSFLNSLNGASLDGLDVFLTCRQCDKNFVDVASLLQHRQTCSVPTGPSAALLESMTSSIGSSSCRSAMQQPVSTQLPEGGGARSFECSTRASSSSVCAENIPAKANKDELSVNLSQLATAPGHLAHTTDLDMDDAARLDSLIIETLNGLGYHTDDGELDSSFIEAFTDEDALVPRRAGDVAATAALPQPPESTAKVATRDSDVGKGHEETAPTATAGRGRASRHRGRRGRGKDMRQLYHTSRSKKKQRRGRWAALPVGKRNGYNLMITTPVTCVPTTSVCLRQDVLAPSPDSSSSPLRPHHTSSHDVVGVTGGGLGDGALDGNTCGKDGLSADMVEPESLSSRPEKPLPSVSKPIAHRSTKHVDVLSRRGVSGRLNKELIHKIVLQKNNFYKVRMKPWRSPLDKLKLVLNIPKSVVKDQPLGEYDYISDTDTDHDPMGAKGIKIDLREVPLKQPIALSERLNIASNTQTTTNFSPGKNRLNSDTVQQSEFFEHQKESHAWKEHHDKDTELGIATEHCKHDGGSRASSGEAAVSREEESQPGMDRGSLGGICSPGLQGGARFHEGASLQALTSPCWRLEDRERWSDAMSCESGSSRDDPTQNWEPGAQHSDSTRPLQHPLPAVSPGASHSLASTALEVFDLGGSASPQLPFPSGGHLGKTAAHFDAEDILEALQLSELGERSRCEPIEASGVAHATDIGQDGSAAHVDNLSTTDAMEKEWSFLDEMSSIFSGNFDLNQELNSNLTQPLLSHGGKLSLNMESNFEEQTDIGSTEFHMTETFHTPPLVQGSKIKNIMDTITNITDVEHLKNTALHNDTCICTSESSNSSSNRSSLGEGQPAECRRGKAQSSESVVAVPSDAKTKPISFLSPVLHCDFWTGDFHPFSPCFDEAPSPSPDSRALTVLERYLPCNNSTSESGALTMSPETRSIAPGLMMRTTTTMPLGAKLPQVELGQLALQAPEDTNFLPSAPLSVLAALCHSDEDASAMVAPCGMLRLSDSEKLELSQNGNVTVCKYTGSLTAEQEAGSISLGLVKNLECDEVHTQPAVTCDEAKCFSENVTLNGVPELCDESPEAAVACIKEKAMVDLSSAQGDPPICSELEPRDSPYFPTDGAPGVGIHSSKCQMPMNPAVGLHDVLYSPISPDSFIFSDAASCDGGSETDIVSSAECGGFAGGASAREDMKPVCRSLVQINEDLHVKSLLDSSTLEHSPKADPEIELMDSIVKSVESSYAITKENVEAVGECIIESTKPPEIKRPKATCEGLLFASEHISLGHRSCNFSATTVAESVMTSSRASPHSSSGDPCPDEPQQQQPQATGGNRCHLTNATESPRRRRNSCPSEGAMGQQLRFAKENGECITSQSDAVPLNILHSSQNESKPERALKTKAMNSSGETCLGERGNPEAVYLHAEPHRGLPTKSAELLVTVVAHHEQELNRTAQHWGLGATRLHVDEDNSAHPVAFTTNRGSQPVELGDRCEAIGEQGGPSCLGSSLLEFTATGGGRGGYEGARDHGGAIVSGSHELPRLNTEHTGPDLDQPVAGSATKRENHSLDYEDAQTVPLLALSDTFGKSPADIEVRALSSGEPEALEEAPPLKKGTHSSPPDPGSKIMSHPCPHSITQAPSSPSIEVITGWGPEEASSLCNVCQASFRSRVGLVRHKAIRHNAQVQLDDISHVKEDAVEGTESVVAESAGAAQEGILHPNLSMLTHNTDLRWPHKQPVADIDGCSRPHIAHLDSTITTTISQVCNTDMATTVNSSRPVQPELSLPQCGSLSPCTPVVENTTQAFVESLFQFNELDHIPAAATHESSGTEMDGADNSPKRAGGVGESVMDRHRLPSLLDGDAIRDLHAQSDAGAGLVKMWEPRAQPRATEEDEEVGGQRTPEPRSPFYSTSAPRVMPGPYDQNKSVEDEEDKEEEENEDTERQDMASHGSREEPMVLEDHGGRSFDADLYQGPCSLQASLPLQDSYPGCPSVAMFSGILEEREENGSCNGNRHPECIPEVAPMEMMGQCELTKSPMLDLPEDPFIEAIERHLSTVRAHADAPRDVPMRGIAEPSAEEPHICDLSSATAAHGGRRSPALDEQLLPSFVEERRLFSPSPSDASEALVDAHLLAEPLPPGFLEGVLRELADEIKTSSRGRHEPTTRNRDKQYKCRACFQWFLTLGELDFHKLSHIPAPPPTCYMCVQRKFSSREQLREHLREKHCKQSQQRTWSCGMCLKELSDMWMYNEHLREHAAQFSKKGQVHKMALMMAACNDEYGARDSDNDEERGPKPQAPPLPVGALPEPVDGTGVDAASVSPGQAPSGAREGLATKVATAGPEQGPEQGPACELAAARIPAGGVHPDCKDPSRDCHHCGKQFPKPFKLQRHLVVHSLQRAHVCQLCPVVFLDASDLRAHLGAAHGVDEEEAEVVRHVTIYDCEQCADVMHVIKKSFICSACNYTFSKKEQFDRHMDKHLTAGGAVRAFRRAVRPRELPRANTSSRALTMDCGPRPKRCKLGVDEGETPEMFAERRRMMFGEEPDEMDGYAHENPMHSETIGAANIFTMCVARSHGFQARIFPSEAPADDDDGDDDGDDDDDGGDDADDEVLQGNSCFTVPHSPPPPLTEGNVCVDEVPMSRERVLRGVSIPAGGPDYSTSTGGTNNSNNTRDTSHSNCTEGNNISRTGGTISSTEGTISSTEGTISSTEGTISCSNSTANANNGTSTGDVSHSTSTRDADSSSNSGTESTITERTNSSNSNSSTITSSSSSSRDITNHSTSMGSTNNTSASTGATNNSTGTGGNESSSSTRDTRHSASSSTDTGSGTNNSCSMGSTDSYSTSTSGSSYSDNTGDTNRRNTADTNNSISRGNTDCNSMGDTSNDGCSSTWGTRTSGSTSTGSIKNSINNSSIGMGITDNSSETRGIRNSSTSIEGSSARGTRAEGNGAEGTSMGVTSDTNISESISDNSSSTLGISGTSAEESPTGVGTTGVAVMGHTSSSSSNRTGDNITEGTSTLGTGTGDTLPGDTGQGGSYTLTEGTSNNRSAECTFMKNISSSHGTGSISKGGTITWGAAACSTTSSYNRKSSPDKPQRGPKRPCDSAGPTGGCREAPSKRLKVAARAPKPGHPNQTVPRHGHHLGLTCGGGGGYVGGVGGGTGSRGTGVGNVTVSGSGNGGTGGGIGGTGGGNVGGGVSSEKVNIAGGGNAGGTGGGNISGKIYGASFGSGDGVSGRKLNGASGGNVSGTFSGTSAGNVNGTSSSAGASSDLEDSRSSVGTLYTAFFSSHSSREVPGPHRRPLLDSLCGGSRTGGPHTARPRPALPASCKSAQSQRDLLNQMFGHRLTTFKIPLRKECKEQLSE